MRSDRTTVRARGININYRLKLLRLCERVDGKSMGIFALVLSYGYDFTLKTARITTIRIPMVVERVTNAVSNVRHASAPSPLQCYCPRYRITADNVQFNHSITYVSHTREERFTCRFLVKSSIVLPT